MNKRQFNAIEGFALDPAAKDSSLASNRNANIIGYSVPVSGRLKAVKRTSDDFTTIYYHIAVFKAHFTTLLAPHMAIINY